MKPCFSKNAIPKLAVRASPAFRAALGFLLAIGVTGTFVSLTACQKANDPAPAAAVDPKVLLNKDLAAFDGIAQAGAQSFDADHAQLFTRIFGGTSGASVRAYLDERIHLYLSPDDIDGYRMNRYTVTYKGWQTDDDFDKNLKSSNKQVGASNVGVGLWLEGVINHAHITLLAPDGKQTPVDSSRVGIMLIGPGYNDDTFTAKDGRVIHTPVPYRQGIIVHEARHSDCTGGVTEADLDVARAATSARDFMAKFTKPACGHLHSFCPETHEYKNLPACDSHPWGAYAVESVFIQAAARVATDTDKRILDAVAIDSMGRLSIDSSAMLRGELGPPDMTSGGLK